MKRPWNCFFFVALAMGGLVGAGQARAGRITFEGHGNDFAAVQFQDGFQFTFVADGWGIIEASFLGGGAPYTHNGSNRLMAGGSTPQVTVTFLGG